MTSPRSPRPRTARRAVPALAASAVALLPLLLAATPASAAAPASGPKALASSFADDNVWQRDVRGVRPTASSATLVRSLDRQVTSRYGGVAAFNVRSYGIGFAQASARTARADVRFDDCQGKGHVPAGLYGPDGQFSDVPVPGDAVPARGSDGQLTVWDPSTDQLWEFWQAERRGGHWYACWGGRIDDVSASDGVFDATWGAEASGLVGALGAVRIEEARRGVIDHAVALQIPEPALRHVAPAVRGDGWTQGAGAVPQGQRFRLDPDVDVDALPGMSDVGRAVARAAQRYGFIVTDTSGAVSVTAESGDLVQARTGKDPWAPVLDGDAPYEVLRGFPWSKLQALPAGT